MKFERLRNLREDHDLTQEQIAQYLHTTQRTYAHYEKGDRGIPLETLELLAEYYNTSIDYLVGRTDFKYPYPRAKKTQKKLTALERRNIQIFPGLFYAMASHQKLNFHSKPTSIASFHKGVPSSHPYHV